MNRSVEVQNKLGVIASIKMIEKFLWEERGNGNSHNLICVSLAEDQRKKIAPITE